MSKFKEYLKTMDKRKKYAGISAIGVVAFAVLGLGIYNIINSKAVNTDSAPQRELIIQQGVENVNKYTGDKKDFHFNKYWADRSGGIYTISEKDNITNVDYKKKLGNEWVYMAAPVEGNFSDFKYINLKVSGDKGKKLFLKLEENLVELKAKFFTLNGKEQILTLDISDVKNRKRLDALKEVMLFASPGEVEDGSFKIIDAWFSMDSATVNRYTGDKKDFHFNKYWEDIFNHGIAIDEENETTTMTFIKPKDNNWVLASTAVEGKLSDFNYATIKVKGEVGQKFLLKLEKGDTVYGEKLVELSGEEEVVIVKLNKDDVEGLDSLKEVRVFPNAGEPENGKLDILDAWFSVEKPEGFKEAGEATPSGANSEYINGWKIEEWTKYVGENVNGLTKVSYNNPAEWAYVTYNVEGKISGNNLLNIYLNSCDCDHVMIKLRGKFKYVDPVGGFNVYEEVEVFNDKIKQGETNLQVDITDAVRELGHVVDVVMFVESSQNVKDVDRVGSLTFGAPNFTEGKVSGNTTSSSKWLVEDWTGYTSEIKDGFTRISYNNPAPWANISYNIKNLLKDNDVLELKLNSNGCDHVQIKLRGKYLNSDPGYKVYQEALVFDGKLSNGERTLKLDLKDAIKELGRENITDIMMFIESNQLVEGLDRKGSLDIYTPVFKKDVQVTPNPGNPESPSVDTDNNKWLVEEWTGYTANVQKDFTRIAYTNPEPWANISYNIKNLLKDNDLLELKLNSNGCDHIQIKLRGKYLNSDPGYKVYDELLIFDDKLKNGEQTLKLNLKDAIKELGRENITDIIMFIESSQPADGLDRKGSLDIYTPVFKKDVTSNPGIETPTPENPSEDKNVVINSSFDSSFGNWEVFKEANKGDASGEIKDGTAVININNIGTENWNVQLVNKKLKLEKGATYKYSIKLKSSVSRPIEIVIQEDGGSYKGFTSKIENANNEYKTYESEFKYDGESSTNLAFLINLGKVTGITNLDKHTVYVDEIKLVKVSNGSVEEKPQEPETPEVPSEVIKGTKKYELKITDEQLLKIGGKITDVILFVESDDTIKDVDRSGEIEILETALLDQEGNKKRIDQWTTDTNWNQYSISKDNSKTTVKYNNVASWAIIWGKVNDDNNYTDKLSIIFNTNGCDHLIVKVKGINGGEIELGKEYVKNMISSEIPEVPETPEAPETPVIPEVPDSGESKPEEPITNNTVTLDVSKDVLQKLGGGINKIIMFVESNPYGGSYDKSGKLEIVEATLQNELGDKININNWTTDAGWNQYKISNEGSKVIVEYNNVAEWAHIISENIDYKEGYNKVQFKLNSIECDHITIKLVGANGIEEEIHNNVLTK